MIGLDAATLALAMPGCPMERALVWAPHLDVAMAVFDINSPQRAADFLAQLGHESGGLKWTQELWGPTPAQVTYERNPSAFWGTTLRRGDRNFKAWTLGNSEPGDGRRYAGHGPIQVTGRANHRQARNDLRRLLPGMEVPDFEVEPLKLTEPKWGSMAAGNFWRTRNLNALADVGDFIKQTEKINGGQNGLEDRLARRVRARSALGAL